jgi:hypothetical protein
MDWMRQADAARQQAFESIDRYNRTGTPQVLLDAVGHFRESLRVGGYSGSRGSRDLVQVGALLREYFYKTDEFWALDDSLNACRDAVTKAVSRADYDLARLEVAMSLYARFCAIQDREALAEGLSFLRALTIGPEEPEFLLSRFYLAQVLSDAYDDSQDVALLEQAVEVGRSAADQPGSLQIRLLIQLARDLASLSGKSDDTALLVESVDMNRRAARLAEQAADGQYRAQTVLELARRLESLALKTSDDSYLEEAGRLAAQAVTLEEDPVKRILNKTIASGIVGQQRRRQGRRENEHLPAPPPPMEDE